MSRVTQWITVLLPIPKSISVNYRASPRCSVPHQAASIPLLHASLLGLGVVGGGGGEGAVTIFYIGPGPSFSVYFYVLASINSFLV